HLTHGKRRWAMSERRLKNEWEVAMRGQDGEWDKTTLRSYEHVEEGEAFTPATPARITPSRRKPVERDHDTLFVFSDLQAGYRRVLDHDTHQHERIPLHNERNMRVAR